MFVFRFVPVYNSHCFSVSVQSVCVFQYYLILAKYFSTLVIKFCPQLKVVISEHHCMDVTLQSSVLDKPKFSFTVNTRHLIYLKEQCFVPIMMHFR